MNDGTSTLLKNWSGWYRFRGYAPLKELSSTTIDEETLNPILRGTKEEAMYRGEEGKTPVTMAYPEGR